MPRIHIEQFDEKIHRNHMPEVESCISFTGYVIVVEVGRYRLEFLSLTQLAAAIEYFEKREGVSTRLSASVGDHWEFQSWISRLPAGINNKHNRSRVLSTLKQAYKKFVSDKHYYPV